MSQNDKRLDDPMLDDLEAGVCKLFVAAHQGVSQHATDHLERHLVTLLAALIVSSPAHPMSAENRAAELADLLILVVKKAQQFSTTGTV